MTGPADPVRSVLAWVGNDMSDPPPLCVVADLGRFEIRLTLCTTRSGLVSVIDTETTALPGQTDPRLARPEAHRPLVLREAVRSRRYRDARVYADQSGPVKAGELIDAFEPYGAALRASTARLVGRHLGLDAGYVLVGDLSGFPLAVDALPNGSRLLNEDTPGTEVVARGHALIASGAVRFPDAYPFGVVVQTREIRDGRIANGHVLVAPAHRLDATGDTVFGDPSRSQAVLVGSDAAAVELDLLVEGELVRPLQHARIDRPPPGRYTLGMRLNSGIAELLFRLDGTDRTVTRTVGPLPASGARL